MKKSLLLLLASALALPVMADYVGEGYYRVENYVTNRYIEIIDNTGSIDMSSQTADLHAVVLQKNFNLVCSNPGSVLYMKDLNSDYQYDIEAQGTSVYQIIGHRLRLQENGSANGQKLYMAYGTFQGHTRYLSDGNIFDGDEGKLTTNGTGDYRKWYILPINNAGDNYFGAALSVNANSKYYGTMYASFPFSPNSSNTKTYIIDRIDHGMAEMKEVTGVIPAGTPVIIEGVGANASDNRLNPGGSANALGNNSLKGVYFNYLDKRPANAVAYNPATMRVLGRCADGSLGFVVANLTTIPANTAYLVVPENSPEEIKCVSTAEFDAYEPPVTYPEALYMIGDFNGWVTPNVNSSECLVLSKSGEATYSGKISYSTAGKFDFKVFDEKTADYSHAYGAINGAQVNLEPGVTSSWVMQLGNNAPNFSIANWGGSQGTVTVDLLTNTLSIVTDKVNGFPQSLYLSGNFNNWAVSDSAYQLVATADGVYTATFDLPYMESGSLEFKLTDGTREKEYGANSSVPYEFELFNDSPVYMSVMASGSNIVITNWLNGDLKINVNLNDMTLALNGPDQPSAPEFGDQIYLIGDMNNWNFNSSEYVLLPETSYGFTGTFDIDPGTYYFRFYSALGDPTTNSIGSAEDPDTNVSVVFTSNDIFTSPFMSGQGCWVIEEWKGGPINFTLNTQSHMLVIYAEGAGVDSIGADLAGFSYAGGIVRADGAKAIAAYNVAGQLVAQSASDSLDLNNLAKGVYIVTAGQKTIKVTVK